ncbi:unnamed protein product [Urochloa humidicola]
MPRGVARGLELEAAVAAEAAWELRQSAASMAGSIESLDMDVDVDSPQHLPWSSASMCQSPLLIPLRSTCIYWMVKYNLWKCLLQIP